MMCPYCQNEVPQADKCLACERPFKLDPRIIQAAQAKAERAKREAEENSLQFMLNRPFVLPERDHMLVAGRMLKSAAKTKSPQLADQLRERARRIIMGG